MKSESTIMSLLNQKGQALILMLAFILVLGVALIYLFNTSQVLAERSQAKVLADHAAYNTAVKQAQLLNANAYMNKAKIANQLATAQAVSVASWAKSFEPMPQNTAELNAIPYLGSIIHESITLTDTAARTLELPTGIAIQLNNLATQSISIQQEALNRASIEAIQQVHEDTIAKSSIGAGFLSEPMISSSKYVFIPSGNSAGMGNSFIKHYQGNSTDPYVGRQRLKDPLLASIDNFTRKRREENTLKIPLTSIRFERRGGTEISNDLNQWKGVDTLSRHFRRGFLGRKKVEKPIAYGSALARSDNRDSDSGNRLGYDGVNSNRKASRQSSNYVPNWDARNSSSGRTGETGVPKYWDLDSQLLRQLSTEEPTLPIYIRVRKAASQLDTTSGKSAFKVGDKLDIESKNQITALSAAEVYFERPLQDRQGRDKYLNKGMLEKSSLFNPYWHVRLTDNSQAAIMEASKP